MGFLRAITEKSRQVEAIDFLENAFSWEDGKRIFHEVLRTKNPTAILAGGDEVAAGIISEAKRHD